MAVNWNGAPDTPGLKLKWADGWIDDFPEDEFAEECKERPRRNYAYRKRRGKKTERMVGDYALTVSGNEAVLDYGGKYESINSRASRGFYIGETQILFTDDSRTVVQEVRFRDVGARRFVSYDIRASWAVFAGTQISVATKPFRPDRHDRRPMATLEGVLRPGQLRFRRQLLEVFGSRCCMTGCTIESTLEAAHIMPYRGPQFDHVQNGLLLRADLHRLYDRLLISIEPKGLLIRIRPSLRKYSEYAVLDGNRVTLPKRRRHPPSAVALADHWRRFRRASAQI